MPRISRAALALAAALALLAAPAAGAASPPPHPAGPHPAFEARCPVPPVGQPVLGGEPVPFSMAKVWFLLAGRDITWDWAPGVLANHVFPCEMWKLPYYDSPKRPPERIEVWKLGHGWWGAFDRKGGHLIWAWRAWYGTGR